MPMTFDLSPELAALQARARDVATALVRPAAAEIDRTAAVPPHIGAAIDALGIRDADAFGAVVLIEEIATASASAAARACLDVDGQPAEFAGLRGVPRVAVPGDRHHLVLAAVCLGVGRAALTEALEAARARGDRPAGDPGAPPHWALADAATELDAARLLLRASAGGQGLPAPAALVYAAGAATRMVDAALRIVGADGYRTGSVLERCARDARAACLILGTEDSIRQAAADALLARPT